MRPVRHVPGGLFRFGQAGMNNGKAMRVIALPLLAAGAAIAGWTLSTRDTAPAAAAAGSAPPQQPSSAAPAPDARAPLLRAHIVARHPHDTAAFTEGLIWHDGALYESVGLEGQSDVRRVDLESGRVVARATIPAAEFGEGLAAWRDTLVSLTWHDGLAHRWSARTLKPLGTMRYTGEGWGLTSDGVTLIRSDGSATLTFHDPATMAERRRIAATLNGRAITQINELEWIDGPGGGAILANVWHTPYLLRIDPATGKVGAVVDLRPIVEEVGARDPEAVANGIAWDPRGKRLFVTGKRWPTLFEIKLEG